MFDVDLFWKGCKKVGNGLITAVIIYKNKFVKTDNIKIPSLIALKGLPFYDFYKRIYIFLKDPIIKQIAISKNTLRYSLRDSIDSISLVGVFAAIIKYVFPSFFKIDLFPMFNPVYSILMFGGQAFIFSFVLALLISVALIFKERKFHYLIFYQGMRCYSVLNLFISAVSLIILNRMVAGNNAYFPSRTDIYIGAFLAICGLILFCYAIIYPLVNYLDHYIKRRHAIINIITVLFLIVITYFINSKFHLQFISSNVIRKDKFCEQLVLGKAKQLGISNRDDIQCMIDECLKLEPPDTK